MRITAIRHRSVPISSAISNAFINFSEMTLSAVAVLTDVVRDGRVVVGYGFNSNGRYAQSGILAGACHSAVDESRAKPFIDR